VICSASFREAERNKSEADESERKKDPKTCDQKEMKSFLFDEKVEADSLF
jgi:hypothetical protein